MADLPQKSHNWIPKTLAVTGVACHCTEAGQPKNRRPHSSDNFLDSGHTKDGKEGCTLIDCSGAAAAAAVSLEISAKLAATRCCLYVGFGEGRLANLYVK